MGIDAAIAASMGVSTPTPTPTPTTIATPAPSGSSSASTPAATTSASSSSTATLTPSQRSMVSRVVGILGGMGATEQQCIDALRAHGWQSDRATDWLINELVGA